MTERERRTEITEDQASDIQRIKKRLELLDQRLDNIDSMVTAVAERVMSQPVILNVTCPHCGKSIEVAVMGSQKPKR